MPSAIGYVYYVLGRVLGCLGDPITVYVHVYLCIYDKLTFDLVSRNCHARYCLFMDSCSVNNYAITSHLTIKNGHILMCSWHLMMQFTKYMNDGLGFCLLGFNASATARVILRR